MTTQIGEYTLTSSDPCSVRAEATFEFSSDPERRKQDVLLYLDDLYKTALMKGEVSVRFTLGGGMASSASAGRYACSVSHATTLVLVTFKSPRYHGTMTDVQWFALVKNYVLQAAVHVGQSRVQLVRWPVVIEIYEHNPMDGGAI